MCLKAETFSLTTTEIFIFRHGETDWNRERRFQGHTDIPLNARGREQALDLKDLLEGCRPEVIVTSDLQRARETAVIANAEMGLPLFESVHLRECVLGEPEGMIREDVIAKFGANSWERWLSIKPEDHDFIYPGGESKSDHLLRLREYLESFCLAHPQFKNLAVSTHGGSLRRLVHHCEGAPIEPVPIANCVLYQIAFEHGERRWIFRGSVVST